MIRPPKHAAGCRGAEDVLLGNALVCRACEWFEAVDCLYEASKDLANRAREEFGSFLGAPAYDVTEQLRRLERLR